jgi:hypothetical protein
VLLDDMCVPITIVRGKYKGQIQFCSQADIETRPEHAVISYIVSRIRPLIAVGQFIHHAEVANKGD